jgi:hypothetical protein
MSDWALGGMLFRTHRMCVLSDDSFMTFWDRAITVTTNVAGVTVLAETASSFVTAISNALATPSLSATPALNATAMSAVVPAAGASSAAAGPGNSRSGASAAAGRTSASAAHNATSSADSKRNRSSDSKRAAGAPASSTPPAKPFKTQYLAFAPTLHVAGNASSNSGLSLKTILSYLRVDEKTIPQATHANLTLALDSVLAQLKQVSLALDSAFEPDPEVAITSTSVPPAATDSTDSDR